MLMFPARRRLASMLCTAAFLSAAAAPAFAQSRAPAGGTLPDDVIARVSSLVDADTPRLVDVFKDLHGHPELGFTETRTAAIVAKELKSLGYQVTEGIGKTGVVGVLRNGEGPTVWFRADMDSNAVKETTGLDYAAKSKQRLADGSEVDVMHACGHDAHVTWMLSLARTMAEMKSAWSGTLVVYGQPAEEVGLGARAMVDDKLWGRGFPKPDFAMGAHTAPIPVGVVANSPGVRMAGVDQLDITFTGLGGHGSTPQMTIDPVVMSAQAVMAYQSIISRTLDPQATGVLTVGSIVTGRDNNVIPENAVLKLNLRWFTEEVRNTMIRRIDEINRGVAIGAGVPEANMPTRLMKGNSGPLVNDPALVARVNPSLVGLLGQGRVLDAMPAVTGSEDFQEAFRGIEVPYALWLVGVAPPELFAKAQAEGRPFPYSNHNPDFFVDLAAIPVGAKVNAVAVLSVFPAKR
jgi:amidohydrolase